MTFSGQLALPDAVDQVYFYDSFDYRSILLFVSKYLKENDNS
jgi:hypothetical protein